MKIKKVVILLVIVGVIVAVKVFHLDQYLTLSYLKGSLDTLKALYENHSLMVIAGYFVIYVLTTSLSLPGASPLGLAGGALFGFWTATLLVSFASTIGATLSCIVSRFLLRDWIQSRFGDRIAKVNEGIEKEGAFYLFTLRLIPAFPFWMINLAMGLTTMSLFKFYWVSQIGMLPGTMVFVNAGTELAKIESVKGIFSPGLIISFALIGIFPIAVKKLVSLYRSRKGKSNDDTRNIILRIFMGKYEEITKARQILGLDEYATLKEIKNKYRELLKEWHPDLQKKNKAVRKEKTIEIINAYKIIMDYCEQYRFSFSREEVEKYFSPEELWAKQFGKDPDMGQLSG